MKDKILLLGGKKNKTQLFKLHKTPVTQQLTDTQNYEV